MSKRANGEGSIYKRKDGRWVAAVTYVDDTGTTRRTSVYARTQAECRAKQREVERRLALGQPVKDSTQTVGGFVEDWIAKSLAASDRRQSTKENYATIARKHLVPTIGQQQLDKLRPSDVEALLLSKRESGLSPSTVRTIYTVLCAALDVAVRDKLVVHNVAAAVKRPTVERREAAYLTAAQAQQLIEATREDRLFPLYALMLGTGLRRGEALALRWSDVDLDSADVRVRGTLSRLSTGLTVTEPKTERSRRTVGMPQQCVDVLRVHRRAQATERLAAGPAWQDHDLVFCSEIGTLLDPSNVLHRFQRLARAAGLDGVSLHTLRHSTPSLLIARGTHLKIVQQVLGHSSYAITADTYAHVAPDQQREAATRLGESLAW